MSRRLVFLNLALLALLAALGWLLRLHWIEARAQERVMLERTVQPRGIFAPPPPPQVKPAAATDYLEVAQKMLFSKDRNPTVVIEVPKPPPAPPEPPMPPLPNFHGIMALFGDPVIIMSVGKEAQKSYHAGDDVGPFKLISFDRENVTLEWRGKTVNAPIDQLVAKVEPPPSAPAPAQQQAAPAAPVTSLAPAPPPALTSLGADAGKTPTTPTLGVDMGAGFRACAMGDTSPPGTVLNGYKKVVAMTLMGNSCHWELVK